MNKYAVAIAVVNDDDNQVFIVDELDELDAMKQAVVDSYEHEETAPIVYDDVDELETIEDVQEYMFNGGYSISLPLKID